jgi:hypothetical protein
MMNEIIEGSTNDNIHQHTRFCDGKNNDKKQHSNNNKQQTTTNNNNIIN